MCTWKKEKSRPLGLNKVFWLVFACKKNYLFVFVLVNMMPPYSFSVTSCTVYLGKKWQMAFNWKWDFLCVNNEKVIDSQAATLSLDTTEIWVISVRDSYQARIHPPGFQTQPCSRSTSWRSLSSRFDGAGIPAKPNVTMWQGNKKYDRITSGKKYIRITKSGFMFFSKLWQIRKDLHSDLQSSLLHP